MREKHKTKEKYSDEIVGLRRKITELEKKDIGPKHTEEKLKEAQCKLEGLLSSMVDLVFAFDEEGKFVFYHAPHQDDLYVPPNKFIGKKHTEVMPPHLNELFIESLKKNKKGEVVEYEYWLEIKGVVRWFAVKLSPLYIGRKFRGSIAVAREITERKHAEESANRFLRTIETAREAITITSANGKMIYTNSAMDELFGYKKGELIGKYASILNAGQQPEAVTEKIMKSLERKGYWEGEINNKRKDETEFNSYARISAFKNKDGKIINFLSTQHDITERKRTEEALKYSEERYRTLAENAMDAIYIVSTKGGFEYVNPAFERIFGYGSEDVCREYFNFSDLVHSDDRKLIEKRRRARNKKERLEPIFEFRIITKKGDVKHVEINTVHLPSKDDRILGIIRDITKRKNTELMLVESESELRKQKQVLEQKNIALREVIAQVEMEKRRIKDDIETNINLLIGPILEKLRIENANSKNIDMLQYNLKSLTSSFGSTITKATHKLTSREIEISNMIKKGLTNKEISQLINVSLQTINTHRRNIRQKLRISNKRINLVSFLRDL